MSTTADEGGEECPVCGEPGGVMPYVEIAGELYKTCRACVRRFVDAYAEIDARLAPSSSRLRAVPAIKKEA